MDKSHHFQFASFVILRANAIFYAVVSFEANFPARGSVSPSLIDFSRYVVISSECSLGGYEKVAGSVLAANRGGALTRGTIMPTVIN